MKTYMPLDGFRWSCDSDSALCDIPQTNVLGQAGGGCKEGQKWVSCTLVVSQPAYMADIQRWLIIWRQ